MHLCLTGAQPLDGDGAAGRAQDSGNVGNIQSDKQGRGGGPTGLVESSLFVASQVQLQTCEHVLKHIHQKTSNILPVGYAARSAITGSLSAHSACIASWCMCCSSAKGTVQHQRPCALQVERPDQLSEIVPQKRLADKVSGILSRIEAELDAVDEKIGERMHILDLDNDGLVSCVNHTETDLPHHV